LLLRGCGVDVQMGRAYIRRKELGAGGVRMLEGDVSSLNGMKMISRFGGYEMDIYF
jgi:hypothetical protein